MELKRYVQINRGDVYDLQDERQRKAYETIKHGTQSVFGVKKTSDNILDFVEVGDLVEDTYGITAKVVDFGLSGDGGEDERIFKCCYVDILYEDVKAIYKRQPNGDYKKYEVK